MNEISQGMRVRLARLGRGWTLQSLSDRCTYSVSYLSLMERDQRPVPDVVKDILGTDDELWFEQIVGTLFKQCPNEKATELVEALTNAITTN